MTQEEIRELPDERLVALAKLAAESSSAAAEGDRSAPFGGDFDSLWFTRDAMIVAAKLDMTISFGDHVVLVSEPDGCQSRTVGYSGSGRLAAMRKAITLLAADSAQYI